MSLLLTTAEGQAELVEAATRAARPVSVGRRISVIGLFPAVGSSTIATLLTRVLARDRPGRTVLVESASDRQRRSAGEPPPALVERLPRSVRERLAYRDGVLALGLTPPPGGSISPPPRAGAGEWRQQVAPLVRHFDVVCTEWPGGAGASEVVDRCSTGQAVCLVAPYERMEAEHTVALARALHERPEGPEVTVAFVDAARTASTWPRMVEYRLPFASVRFGYDRRLAIGEAPSARTVRAATLVGAAVMGESAQRGGSRWA